MKRIYTHILLIAVLIAINSTTIAQSINITGPAGSGQFGETVTVLANGNYVVTDPGFNDGAIQNVGAVYFYDGSTHTLISTLKGSTANDRVGNGGIITLSNGNYVVSSYNWNNGANTNAGAVTWGNSNTGTSGVVGSSNSLVGSTKNDQIGYNSSISGVGITITALTNGNYVVSSRHWDNGAIIDAGAATWGNGSSGISGVISSSNSLVGSKEKDEVGSGINADGVTALSNGNYVVRSKAAATWGNGTSGITGVVSIANSLVGTRENSGVGIKITALSNGNYVVSSHPWNNDGIFNAGAVTWGNGSTGISGEISSSNSLVGSKENDQVGTGGITVLSNGNYVVNSFYWDNESIFNAGAVTWGNGSTGISGVISSGNSLVGTRFNDRVGFYGVIPLSNGNYVVRSSLWNNGTIKAAGAVTWGNGSTGISGGVNSNNSLVGSTENDQVGFDGMYNKSDDIGIFELSNGNYVVRSLAWDNGSIENAGAVTWGNGNSGITGVVNSSNSLVGSTKGDEVGRTGVFLLSYGNYVVCSENWDNGAITEAGAATWGNGSNGTSGVVSSSNSLVGSTVNDRVGFYGVTPLSNGNYVVRSPWNNSGSHVGAVTWGNGSTGISGEISSSNSLVGSASNRSVGSGVTALTNGNYVVSSSNWNNGAGAVTWGNGSTGVPGEINNTNSLVGSNPMDGIGSFVDALNNGNYVVSSPTWYKGGIRRAGAVTWGNGNRGISGEISSSNSLVGSRTDDRVGGLHMAGRSGVTPLSNGNYVVSTSNWSNGQIIYAGAITWGDGSIGVTGVITSCNSVLGSSESNGQNIGSIYNPVNEYLIVQRPKENIVTIYNPTAIALANSLDTVNVNINGTNPVPLKSAGNCRIIAILTPNGGSTAINGIVDAKVWIESSVPTYSGQSFVSRHFEITPARNSSTATAKVTLYFTQQEFNDFNEHPGSTLNLPVNAADDEGKSNLKIGKYPGISSDSSGLPGTYSQGATVIDPDDGDIVWNADQSRWEVSFDVTGFSGFIVQTSSTALPLTLLEFNGRQQNNNAVLNWKTENEQNSSLFQIERSINGKRFTSIGNVKAANTAGVHQYGFTDDDISTLGVPVVYYRLKQVDLDGRFVYSKIIALSVENKNVVLIYPNPVINELNISVTVFKGDQAHLKIIDNKGRVVKLKKIDLSTGNTSLSIDISSLSKGMYYVEIKGETINERKGFVKQ